MREHLIAFVAAATKLATDAGVELRLGDEDSGLLRCGAGYWEPGKVLWLDGGRGSVLEDAQAGQVRRRTVGSILLAALLIAQHPEPTLDGDIARAVDPKYGQLVTTRDDGPYCVTYLVPSSVVFNGGKRSEPGALRKGQMVWIWQDGKRNAILVLAFSVKD